MHARQVLGYVLCTSNKVALHVSKVAVDPLHRRKGIATALIQVCVFSVSASPHMCWHAPDWRSSCMLQEAVRVSQRSYVTLHVDPRNTSAAALYAALGFQLNAVLEDYYAQGCPAHKLCKDLSTSL
jgi:ribosomal protein S18 acetylase RimI-like enzyme